MTSIIKLQAISGVEDESPLCYLLQVDEFRFLLDCGWNEFFDMRHIDELKKYVKNIDAVLLSYPDHLHLGALPYMVGKCGLNCPIYATIPVYKMGQMFMYDLYQSHKNNEEFDIFTLDDVDAAFDKIVQLKYSQNVGLKGKGHGLTITPLPAGHMIGGTIWKIMKDGEEDIVYAVDYNHKRERHLNGCVLESISRPALLITDAFNATYQQTRRRIRDEQLMTNILTTLRNNGNVLVTVDTAGRVLELAQLLDQLWRSQESGLSKFSLALLNNVSYNVVEFAKSQVEWMSDQILRAFEDHHANPFHFKHLQLCHSLQELAKVPSPKVVLASVTDLECGFSRELFMEWCQSPRNCVVLTSRTTPGTLARKLIENPMLRKVSLIVNRRVRLEGAELEEYKKKEKEKEAEEQKKRLVEEMAEADSSDDSEDEMEAAEGAGFGADGTGDGLSGGERGGRSRSKSGSAGLDPDSGSGDPANLPSRHDLMFGMDLKAKPGSGGFFKSAKKTYPMYPLKEEKIKWDDYGEIIKEEDFKFAENASSVLPGFGDDGATSKDAADGADANSGDLTDVPTKCLMSNKTLEILANVVFIDFEGRSDGESVKRIISQMRPRQLILVHGTVEATKSLADYCRSQSIVQGKILTPRLFENVDATTESHIFQVKLKDSLFSSLLFAKAKDTEIAWVEGVLKEEKSVMDGEDADDDERMEDDDDDHLLPLNLSMEERRERKREIRKMRRKSSDGENLDESTASVAEKVPTLMPVSVVKGHTPIFVNEPKLSDFKLHLLKAGFTAEFSGGVLIINSCIAVKRNAAGKVTMEGMIGPDYYKVRELLYDQYAII